LNVVNTAAGAGKWGLLKNKWTGLPLVSKIAFVLPV
jgi:hypothetical protein